MKSDKRYTSPIQSVSNKTLSSQHRIEKGLKTRQYRSANPSRRASAVSFDIFPIQEDQCLVLKTDESLRRMSAPELPPILDSRKLTNNHNMGNGNREYYKSRSNGISNNSDSSLKGGRVRSSPQSASSSSSHAARNSGNVTRSKTWMTPEQTITTTIPEGIKLDIITNTNGISVPTPRSVKNGDRTDRLPSKDYSSSSGNNNTRQSKKFQHCASEPRITPIETYMGGKKGTMKRNSSDNKLGQNKRLISIEKTQTLTQNKYNSGNVNGMRRYSSTFQLNNNPVKNKSSEIDDYDDDDTDSETGKDQMIIKWLIGVQSEEAEEPPDPYIEYAETPVQTDTAIHIVYSES